MESNVVLGGWVNVDSSCPIDSHVFERSVEFRFGGHFGDFTLMVERDALGALAEATVTAMAPTVDPDTEMNTENADDAA